MSQIKQDSAWHRWYRDDIIQDAFDSWVHNYNPNIDDTSIESFLCELDAKSQSNLKAEVQS